MKELLAAFDLETVPQLSLGTAALLIFGACALLALVRGILRILLGSLVLCASGYAAYLAWVHAPVVAPGGDFHWVSFVPPAIVGILVFVVLRKLMRFLARPGGEPEAGENRPTLRRRAFVLLFSLLPASLLSAAGAAVLRNAGSVAEIRRFAGDEEESGRSAFLAALKGSIDRHLPSAWLAALDPLADDARVTLAKLVALGDSAPPPKAIPVLEEPQIRSLIENDERLRALARSGRYADILRDPRLDRVVADPDLRRMLEDLRL